MAVHLGAAFVDIVPSTGGLGRALSREFSQVGTQSAREFSRSFAGNVAASTLQSVDKLGGQIVDRLGAAAKRGVQAIGLAAAAVGGLAAAGGLKRVLDTEDATILMRQLGLSVQEVDRALKGVDRTFDGTPFANPDGFNITAQLLASGRSLDQVESDLRNIGNVTAQTLNKDLTATSQLFLKTAATGRLYATELNSLSLMGIPIRQILAEGLNVSVDALNDMVSRGEVTFETLMDIIGATERFDGAAQAIGNSTRGAFKNVFANLSRLGQAFLDPLFGENGHAVTALLGLRLGIRSLHEPVRQAGQAFARWLIPTVESLVEWVKTRLVPALRDGARWLSDNRDRIMEVARVVGPAVGIVAALAAGVNLLGRAWRILRLATPIGLLLGIASALVYAWQNSETFRDVVTGAFERIRPLIERTAAVLRDVLAIAIHEATRFWELFGDEITTIAGWMSGLLLAAMDLVLDSLEWMTRNWDTLGPILEGVATVIAVTLIPHFVALATSATVNAAKVVAAWALTNAKALAAAALHSAAILLIIAKWVLLGAAALIGGAQVAAGWLLSLGPIGWVLLAVVALAAAFAVAWAKSERFRDIVKGAFEALMTPLRVVRDLLAEIAALLNRVPGVGKVATGGAGAIWEGILNSIPGLRLWGGGFDRGGVIPGPLGAPRLILAHAGETVLPTHRAGASGVADPEVLARLDAVLLELRRGNHQQVRLARTGSA